MTELERSLVALGRELEVPAAPNLSSAVMQRLASRRREPVARRPLALAVALVVLALLTATLAIPDARSALFRVLHIGGEEIEFVDELPEVSAQPALPYTLGREVSLTAARRAAGFRIRLLDEKPDHVYVGSEGTVWFLYGTPQHVRLLVAQTANLSVDSRFMFKKVAVETHVTEVRIDGVQGFFLSGEPHVLLLVDSRGEVIEESARLAQDVLVWSRGGITYRLEGDFRKNDALHLARSLH
jgi:hypothetical protein